MAKNGLVHVADVCKKQLYRALTQCVWCLVGASGWFCFLCQVLSSSVPVAAESMGIGLTATSTGVERDKSESLRAGARAALEFFDRGMGGYHVPLALTIEESFGDTRSRAQLIDSTIRRGNMPVIITGAELDASLGRGVAELQEVLLLSTSVLYDPARAGALSIQFGRSVSSVIERLRRFLKDRGASSVWIVSGTDAWAPDLSRIITSTLRDAGTSVHALPNDGDLELVRDAISRRGGLVGSKEPSYVVIIGRAENTVSLLERFEKQLHLPIVMIFGCNGGKVRDDIARYPGGLYSIDPQVSNDNETFRWLQSYISERYHPSLFTFDALIAFDAVSLIAESFHKGKVTGKALREYIVHKGEFTGVSGRIQFWGDGSSRRGSVVNIVNNGECRELQS